MPRLTKEGRAAYMRDYTSRPEPKAKAKTRYQLYYAANRDNQITKSREYYERNKERIAKRQKEYRLRNPNIVIAMREKHKAQRLFRRSHVKRTYGITLEENDAIFAKFGGICWLCKKQFARFLDHCHQTGKVRGALCHNCNVGLGNFKDNPALLQSAITYLKGNI